MQSEPSATGSPLKWSSVSLSDVVARGKRLEASVFDIESKAAYQAIKACKYPKTNLIGPQCPVIQAHYGSRLKRNYIPKGQKGAIGFIGSAEMLDINPRPDKFMVDDGRVADLHVKQGTVLISRSGTIGNLAYVNRTLEKLLISEHAMRLECQSFPGYIYAYLKSKAGQALIRSNIYGAVIQQVEPEHLATIPVPDAPEEIKEKIHCLIARSYELRDESNDWIEAATNLLTEALALPPMEQLCTRKNANDPVETFCVPLRQLDGRADASYHVPVVDAILRHLYEYAEEVTEVGDSRISRAVVLPGRFKRVYVEKDYGVKFIGGKEMNQLNPSTEKYLSRHAHQKQLAGALGIKPYSILTPARGSLGDVVLPCKHFCNWAISDNMMQILSYEDICGYVYIFLNTEYGRALIQRFTYGGVVDAIEPWHIQQVQIPLLADKVLQERINALALEANEKRYEAYCLEQEASRLMEDEVIRAR